MAEGLSEEPPVLDVRSPERFGAGHRAGAVNVPLEELADRVHELPPPDAPLLVFDEDGGRAERARALLASRGRTVEVRSGAAWLGGGPVETGPSRGRLYRPHPLLVEALPLIEAAWGGLAGRRAVDLGCGAGRDAVYLAERGLAVRAIDILPDALEKASALAARRGVVLTARQADLAQPGALAPASVDLAVGLRFLCRPLLPAVRDAVRPGGFVVWETFTEEHRRVHGKPRRDRSVLRAGELRAAFAGWQAAIDREDELASLVARRV